MIVDIEEASQLSVWCVKDCVAAQGDLLRSCERVLPTAMDTTLGCATYFGQGNVNRSDMCHFQVEA